MQVIEVITKKTLAGEEVRYVLQGGSDKTSTVFLDQVDGEVFDSSEKARKILVQRATGQVNKLVDIAVTKAKEWYKSEDASPESPRNIEDIEELRVDDVAVDETQKAQTVVMPDGTVAKIRLPSGI